MERQRQYNSLTISELKKQTWSALNQRIIDDSRKKICWICTEPFGTASCEKFWSSIKSQCSQGQLINLSSYLLRYLADHHEGWLAFLELVELECGEQDSSHQLISLLLIQSPKLLNSDMASVLKLCLPTIVKCIRICVMNLGLTHTYEQELLLPPILEDHPELPDLPMDVLKLFAQNRRAKNQKKGKYTMQHILFPTKSGVGNRSEKEEEEETLFWKTLMNDSNVVLTNFKVIVKAPICLEAKSGLTITPFIELYPGFHTKADLGFSIFHFPEPDVIQTAEPIDMNLKSCPKEDFETLIDYSFANHYYQFKPAFFVNIPQLSKNDLLSITIKMKVWETNSEEFICLYFLMAYLESLLV